MSEQWFAWGTGGVVVLCGLLLYRVVTDVPLGCWPNEVRKFAVLREVKFRLDSDKGTDEAADSLRQWASELDDRCLRAEYRKWISFFDSKNKRRRKVESQLEIDAQRRRRRQRRDEMFRRVDEYHRTLPKPEPK